MSEKLITKSFERLLDKGKNRGFITLNYLEIALKKLEDLSEIEFLSEKK